MTQYRAQETNGVRQYFDAVTNKPVPEEKLPVAIKEELDLANVGTIIDSESITKDADDGIVGANSEDDSTPDADPAVVKENEDADKKEEEETDAPVATVPKPSTKVKMDDGKEAPKSRNPYKKAPPSTEKGFGFPRRNGKTVDIFDLKTPHTQIRNIAGLMVPLSDVNYREKTDAEIYDQLLELDLIEDDPVYQQQAN